MRFLKQAIRRPKETGAIAPSSRQLAELIVDRARLAGSRVVVELGPGGGAFTGPILEALPAEAKYLGIEINADFVEQLRSGYPRASFAHGTAQDVRRHLASIGEPSCDRVVSGIPWSFMSPRERDEVLAAIADALVPDGVLVTFAYFPLNHLPPGKEVRRDLERHFRSVTRSETVYANVPPAFVYVCVK